MEIQRADLLRCCGGPLRMLNLDRLADEGTVFEQVHKVQPVRGSTRAALFTGCTRIRMKAGETSMAVGDNVKTIAPRLRTEGCARGISAIGMRMEATISAWGLVPMAGIRTNGTDMRCYLSELTEESAYACGALPPWWKMAWTRRSLYATVVQTELWIIWRSTVKRTFPTLFPMMSRMVHIFARSHGVACIGILFCQKAPAGTTRSRTSPRITGCGRRAPMPGGRGPRDAYYFDCNSFVGHEAGRVLEVARRFAPNATITVRQTMARRRDSTGWTRKAGHLRGDYPSALSCEGPGDTDRQVLCRSALSYHPCAHDTGTAGPASHCVVRRSVRIDGESAHQL